LTWWIRVIDRKYRLVGRSGGCNIADTGTSLCSTKIGMSA
jgi:hypothetical protein